MTQDLETVMKQALDGKFYSFFQTKLGTTRVRVTEVSPNYMPDWPRYHKPERRGSWKAAWLANRRKRMWTEERIAQLKTFHSRGYGAKKMQKEMQLGRCEIEIQLNKMGLRTRSGGVYK